MRGFLLTVGIALICMMQVTPHVGVADVQAQSADPCMSATTAVITCQTRENAWNRCTVKSDAVKAAHPTWSPACYYHSTSGGFYSCYVDHDSGTGCGGYGGIGGGSSGIFWSATCAPGGTWQESTKSCFSAAACLAKPAFASQGTLNLTASDSRCSAGCQFQYQGMRQSLTVRTGATIAIGYGGSFKPTGSACGAGDPAPGAGDTSPPSQLCTPAGSGQTYCVKADGQHCATASTGRQICWRPGETGEKTDGDTLQVRNAGASPVTPTTTPPPGDAFVSKGSPVTTDTGVSGVTITTTTQNYGTTSGTNAGGAASDQGENADGTSGQSPGGQGDSGSGDGDGLNCDDCDNDDGSAAHAGDSIWGADDTQTFTADEAGLGFGASCPAPPTVAGVEMDFAAFCTLMQAIGLLVLAAAHMHALYIIVGD